MARVDGLTVRRAGSADEATVLELLAHMDREDGGSRVDVITADHLRRFVFCETPRAEALLAEVDARGIGLAAFRESAGTLACLPEIHLDDLYVEPPFRRFGVGRQLLAAVSRVARERAATRVLLNVQATNTGAIGFYEALGGVVFPDSRACAFAGEALEALADRGEA